MEDKILTVDTMFDYRFIGKREGYQLDFSLQVVSQFSVDDVWLIREFKEIPEQFEYYKVVAISFGYLMWHDILHVVRVAHFMEGGQVKDAIIGEVAEQFLDCKVEYLHGGAMPIDNLVSMGQLRAKNIEGLDSDLDYLKYAIKNGLYSQEFYTCDDF